MIAFLQSDFTNEKIKTEVNTDDDDQDDNDDISDEQPSFDFSQQYSSLKSLCDLLTIVHPIKKEKSNIERMFSFNGIIPIQDLDYSITQDGEYVIDIPRLWSFVRLCVNVL